MISTLYGEENIKLLMVRLIATKTTTHIDDTRTIKRREYYYHPYKLIEKSRFRNFFGPIGDHSSTAKQFPSASRAAVGGGGSLQHAEKRVGVRDGGGQPRGVEAHVGRLLEEVAQLHLPGEKRIISHQVSQLRNLECNWRST